MNGGKVTGKASYQPHEAVRYAVQRGPSPGLAYFQDLTMGSLVFYFQDYTSLNDLYRLTGCDNPYNYPAEGNPGAVRLGQVGTTSNWLPPMARTSSPPARGVPNRGRTSSSATTGPAASGFRRARRWSSPTPISTSGRTLPPTT